MKAVHQSLSTPCPFLAACCLGIQVSLLPGESQAFGESSYTDLESP